MKRTVVILSIILLGLNVLFGILLSAYAPFNVTFTSIVIAANAFLIILLYETGLKDAFVISLTLGYLIAGFLEFVMGLLSRPHIQDNGWLIAVILLIAAQVSLLLICRKISKTIK